MWIVRNFGNKSWVDTRRVEPANVLGMSWRDRTGRLVESRIRERMD